MFPGSTPLPWLKPALLVGGFSPLVRLGALAYWGGLGPNPVEKVLNQLGLLALILLWASLACSPLKQLTGWTWPLRVRKTLGLLAFAYACLHLLAYVGLDQFFDWAVLWEDVTKRGFMVVGFAAFLLLVPLAATSTQRWVQRLGHARWRALHLLVYPAALLSTVHFVLREKKDLSEPLAYAAVLALLLAFRVAKLWAWVRRRSVKARAAA